MNNTPVWSDALRPTRLKARDSELKPEVEALADKLLDGSITWDDLGQLDSAAIGQMLDLQGFICENASQTTPAKIRNLIMQGNEQALPAGFAAFRIRIREVLEAFDLAAGVLIVPMPNVAVRSLSTMPAITLRSDEGEVFYSIVKDSDRTVMLSLKVEQSEVPSHAVKLRREGRLLSSFPLANGAAEFPGLGDGRYVVEVTDPRGETLRSIPIEIIAS